MAYAYAYDKGLRGMSRFGLNSFPSAALVDGTGTVVWKGHPSKVNGALIERYLVGALPQPLFTWPAEAKGARKAFVKGNLAKALKAAEGLGDGGAAVLAGIRAAIEGRAAQVERLHAEGDFLAVEEIGRQNQKYLKGLPEVARVEEILARLDDDAEARAILKAQRKVRKLIPERVKKKDRSKIIQSLRKIASQHPDTAAQRDADRAIERLRSG